MKAESSRLDELKGSKFLNTKFAKYDQDVSKYFDELFDSMKGEGNGNKRANTMIDNVVFKGFEGEKKNL